MYERKHFISFKNRELQQCKVWLSLKDYAGPVSSLEGGPNPFVLSYRSGDDNIIEPIRGSSAAIEFYNNGGTPLLSFASNEDNAWKVEFEVEDVLKWVGFIVQDDCREEFAPVPYLVTLQATDNIALLKDVVFKDVEGFNPIYFKFALWLYFYNILKKTGVDLPINIYVNVWENAMTDRSAGNLDPFIQVGVDSRTFLKDRNTWDDCYTILHKILSAWSCTLMQVNGEWQIVRWPEAKDFSNDIPGLRYRTLVNIDSITLNSYKLIGLNHDIYPLNANHERSIVRPVKEVTKTFNYEFPQNFIINSSLQYKGALISSTVIGTTRVDLYELEYFTYEAGNGEVLVIKTNTITGIESERYIHLPNFRTFNTRLVSNQMEVDAKDRFECSLSFRANTNVNSNLIFRFGFLLKGATANYTLTNVSGVLVWNNIGGSTQANSITKTVLSTEDKTEWRSIDLFHGSTDTYIPAIPVDGLLELHIRGFNDTNASQPTRDTHIKDISFNYTYYINDSTQIIGHEHKSLQPSEIKKKDEETIYVDDAPKRSPKGVMFLQNNTRTSLWHRGQRSEALQFGFIQKIDTMFLRDNYRFQVEGDFFGTGVNPLSIMELTSFPGFYFIMGQVNFNYMTCVWNGTLEELWHLGEAFDHSIYENTFKYLYKDQ